MPRYLLAFIALEIIPRPVRDLVSNGSRRSAARVAALGNFREDSNASRKFLTGFIAAAALLIFVAPVSASLAGDVVFPVPELGNCENETVCRAYCDDLAHKDACLTFAGEHGLIEKEEIERIKNLPAVGPGGCKSESECRAYCDDSSHLEECLTFGKAHDLISDEEVEKAEEFLNQTGPGGCRGAIECRAYCEQPENNEECLKFGNRKGLISKRDLEVAERVLKEGGPGGCKSEKECRAFCEDPAHIDECLNFAEKHGFVDKDDAMRLRKAGVASGPGGCKGREECRAYCEDESHQTECLDFAEKNGFMTKEEIERARKFIGKTGPGGCKGEQCRDFCEHPDNSQTCLEFAEREGVMSKHELERAKKFLKASEEGGPGGCRGPRQCREYCGDPAHGDECFGFAKKQGLINPEEEKQFESGQKIRTKMMESGGPGGCKTDEECRVYCRDPSHVEECVAFGAAHGGIPETEVRRMLKQFTEGRFEHGPEGFGPPEDFRRFEEEARRKFEEFRQLETHFRGKEFPGGDAGFGPPGGFGSRGPGPGFPPPREGFPGGGPGFVGPGGCTSPAECIKFCSEHKEECFSFGPPGRPGVRPPEGGIPPGHEFPQIRGDIIHEFKPEDLPPDFHKKSEEERRGFFRKQFEEFRGGPPAEGPLRSREGEASETRPGMPGRPEGFPGRPGEFPGRPGEFPGGQHPEGFRPSEGREFQAPGGLTPQFPIREGFHPPENFRLPEGSLPPSDSFVPPPSGSTSPPPADNTAVPPPTSLLLQQGTANLLNALRGFIGLR